MNRNLSTTLPKKLKTAQIEQLRKIDSALCLYRWTQPCIQIDSGATKLCCKTKGENPSETEIKNNKSEVILNSEFNKNRRREMLNGIRHKDCEQCWTLEEKGLKSPRQGFRSFMNYFIKNGIYKSRYELALKMLDDKEALIESHNPFMLEISLGNLCHLSCIYCSEEYSSKWAAEKINAGELNPSYLRKKISLEKDLSLDVFWDWINTEAAKTLKCICFIGGETILNPELFSILEKFYVLFQNPEILSSRKDKIVIQIVTNMNIPDQIFDNFLLQI